MLAPLVALLLVSIPAAVGNVCGSADEHGHRGRLGAREFLVDTRAAARGQRDDPTADTAAFPQVRALIERLTRAVRAADGEGMLSVYVEDDPVTFSSHGVSIQSRAAIAAQYRSWSTAQMRGGYMHWQSLRLYSIGPSAVLAEGSFRVALGVPNGAPADTLLATWSGLFEQRQGRWGLAHEHESFARKPSR